MKPSASSAAFEKLLADVRRCTVCAKFLPLGPRPVVQLSQTVKLLIIGQAPGTRVHESGIPFDDKSGDRLRQWLQLTREEFYDEKTIGILPMGFCYPGKGTSGDLPPRPECAPLWHDKLLSHLTQLRVVLLIGRYAIEKYLPQHKDKSLTELMQEWDWKNSATNNGNDNKTKSKTKLESELKSEFILESTIKIPMVHPSPRNQLWIAKNPWFESNYIPKLRRKLSLALKA
jgi:uracil-DNA glycosylase